MTMSSSETENQNIGPFARIRTGKELVLSLPKSTCRVEQLFSKLKVIKTKRRSSLSNSTLDDLLEINVEGPPLIVV